MKLPTQHPFFVNKVEFPKCPKCRQKKLIEKRLKGGKEVVLCTFCGFTYEKEEWLPKELR